MKTEEKKFGKEHHSSIKVICLNDNKIHDSIKDASDYYMLNRCSVSLVCKNKLKQTGGYRFNFLNKQLPTGDQLK